MTRTKSQDGKSRVGLIAAMVVGVAFVGVIVWFVVNGDGPQRAAADDEFTDVENILDIRTDLESGKGLNLQFADKDDPSRVAATLKADSFRPVEVGGVVVPDMFELKRVEARVLQDNGETILIESDEGRFFMPDRKAGPESGSLSGSPKISLLPVGDPNVEPRLVASFDEVLRFNFAYSHVETPGRLHVVGRGFEFQGNGVDARLSQQRERIDELVVERGEFLRYDPGAARAANEAEAAPADAQSRANRPGPVRQASARRVEADRRERIMPVGFAPQAANAPAAVVPHLAFYRATFSDSVQLKQGTKRVTADQLESWVRLIDHKIPDRTKNPGGSVSATSRVEALLASMLVQVEQNTPVGAAEPEPEPAAQTAATDAPSEELVELTWTGRLRVVPLVQGEPAPLARDDAAFRFTATETGLVRFFDEGASGHAAVAEYAATREMLTLTGPGGSVLLEDQSAGWIEASKTVVRLATGDVTVVGPGQVNDGSRANRADDEQKKWVNWVDQADFAFRVEDGRMTGDIDRASFAGRARAVDGDRRVEGEMLVALFGDDTHGNRVITQVDADDMTATDGIAATMKGRHIKVPFRITGPRKSEPDRVEASGDVEVKQDDKRISAQSLTAQLAEDEDGKLTVSDVVAARGARYREGDRIDATADRIEANGLDAIADLFGTDDEPAKIVYDTSTIIGPRIRMEQDPQRGRVVGAGSFAQDKGDARIAATWQEGMSFDRSFGVLECVGGATVDQTLADGEMRAARGDQLTIEFVDIDGEMVFDAASVFGTAAAPATVESRRAATTGDDPVSLMHLRSAEIMATGGGLGLIVPAPGRLVILDRREGESKANLDGWDRGHAMFTWADTLVVDRLLGTVRFSGDAQAIHRTLDDGRTAELAADSIVASFVETEAGDAEITALDAEGTAYFRMEDREILAAVLRFDTVAKVVHALASDTEPIRFIDNETGAVMSARTLTWDLATDRIEMDQPSPLTLPRSR